MTYGYEYDSMLSTRQLAFGLINFVDMACGHILYYFG